MPPLFLAGQKPSAGRLNLLAKEDVWTPALDASSVNPDLGIASDVRGLLWVNGQKVDAWYSILFGTGASAGTGNYRITLPTAYPLSADSFDASIGTVRMFDSSTATQRFGIAYAVKTLASIEIANSVTASIISNSIPWTWSDGDFLTGHVSYLTDFGV